ncbi:MAG: LytTR family DNA-binding domain-containing protein [Bacteroidota bacterium]
MQYQLIPAKLLIVNHRKQLKIPMSNIVMLEAAGNYTIFHLRNHKKHLYAKCINTFEEFLYPEGFLRVHRAYIINPQYILDYDEESSLISMMNNLKATVSRRKKVDLKFEMIM